MENYEDAPFCPETDKYIQTLSDGDKELAIKHYSDPKNNSISRLPSGKFLPNISYCPDCKCKRLTDRCACMCGSCYTCGYRWICNSYNVIDYKKGI